MEHSILGVSLFGSMGMGLHRVHISRIYIYIVESEGQIYS
jgi:hypothetical protein